MDFTVNIKNAPKQLLLVHSMPVDSYTQTGGNITITGIYQENKRVDDAYRYVINIRNMTSAKNSFSNGKYKFNDQTTFEAKRETIVLIIESPHEYEYDTNFIPKSPAQNTTGERIETHIVEIINHHNCLDLNDGDYDLIICNPVQFQTSLFQLHRQALSSKNSSVAALRDKAWLAIYPQEKENFFKRLTSYNPKVIINGCTGGKAANKLKSYVNSEISEWNETKKIAIWEADKHACMWASNTKLSRR